MRLLKGNSLQDDRYVGDINKISRGIERWGKVTFKKSFHGTGKTLEIGRQRDDSSCGICVVNSVEHRMFGTPLFAHSERDTFCVYYFTKTIQLIFNGVSTGSFPTNELHSL